MKLWRDTLSNTCLQSLVGPSGMLSILHYALYRRHEVALAAMVSRIFLYHVARCILHSTEPMQNLHLRLFLTTSLGLFILNNWQLDYWWPVYTYNFWSQTLLQAQGVLPRVAATLRRYHLSPILACEVPLLSSETLLEPFPMCPFGPGGWCLGDNWGTVWRLALKRSCWLILHGSTKFI